MARRQATLLAFLLLLGLGMLFTGIFVLGGPLGFFGRGQDGARTLLATGALNGQDGDPLFQQPPHRSLVFWALRLAVGASSTPVSPGTWWNVGLQQQMLSLGSAILSEPDFDNMDSVHYLVASNVDESVLRTFLLDYLTRSIHGLSRAKLERVLFVWEIPPKLARGYADDNCLKFAWRGEILSYPRLSEYRHLLYLDGDVFVKRPLTAFFTDFARYLEATPTERHKLHIIPEAAAFWSNATYKAKGWDYFATGEANASDLENRFRNHQRPFNGGIMLYELNPFMLAAFAEAQEILRRARPCPKGDQPFYNEYFCSRLIASWHFFCGIPNATQINAMNTANPRTIFLNAKVGQSYASTLCGQYPNRGFYYSWLFACQAPFKVDTHTLVHFVSSGIDPEFKHWDMMRYMAAYFGNRTLDIAGFRALWGKMNMPTLTFAWFQQRVRRLPDCTP